jgi:hypothetical protein
MLQWLPGTKTEVIWNDRQDNRFVSHILDVHSRIKGAGSIPTSMTRKRASGTRSVTSFRPSNTRANGDATRIQGTAPTAAPCSSIRRTAAMDASFISSTSRASSARLHRADAPEEQAPRAQ